MNTVFFDVETQKTFDEVGGRENIRRLGFAAAVTYSTADGKYHHYVEATVADLIAELKAAELVVGFNILNFDYEVLRAYTVDPLSSIPTVDMLDHIYRRLGFRVSLDNLAQTTLRIAKSADGLQSVAWYKAGQIRLVLEYCQHDVDITRQLYEFGRLHKHVRFRDTDYRVRDVAVNW